MNRRSFASLLAVIPFARMAHALPIASLRYPGTQIEEKDDREFLSEEECSKIARDFVENNKTDERSLYLFKNRAGQSAFTVYHPGLGIPSTVSAMFLVSGVPIEAMMLPIHLEVKSYAGGRVAGIYYDGITSRDELEANLRYAYALLKDPGQTNPSRANSVDRMGEAITRLGIR